MIADEHNGTRVYSSYYRYALFARARTLTHCPLQLLRIADYPSVAGRKESLPLAKPRLSV